MFTAKFFENLQKSQDWTYKYYSAISKLQNAQAKPGISPHETVFEVDGKVKLLRFLGSKKTSNKFPLLISYALVNRFIIADLQHNKSMIERLLQADLDVYVVDWGYPDPSDRYTDLDDYVNYYLKECVEFILQRHEVKHLDLLGICQGGTLAVCYNSIYPETVRRLITMVTPINFQTEKDILSHIVNKVDVDEFVAAFGNISGDFLNTNFNLLQPANLNIKKWLNSVHSLTDDKFSDFFLNMEAWISDSPDQAGKAYKEFIEKFYQGNKLMNGDLMIGNEAIDLKSIKQPVLNIFGLQDHLVPPDASRALKDLIGSVKYEELAVDTGHIGMYVSGKAKEVPEKIAKWLAKS